MSTSPCAAAPNATAATLGQRVWRRFCRIAVGVFYRRFEIAGLENLPADGAVVLCANHVNALVDALVVQAMSPRSIHPLARSGLFRRPLLRPILAMIQAVPIYRRREGSDDASAAAAKAQNDASFRRCYDYLEAGRVLLIFPEGQSHSDPSLRPIKTGAARIALGAVRDHGRVPTIVPVGLIFTHKGRFRGDVLVQVGEPVALEPVALEDGALKDNAAASDERALIDRWTESIRQGLYGVTLNVDAWEDVALLGLVQRFEAMRHARDRAVAKTRSGLARRYRAFQRLYDTHRWLRVRYPERIDALRARLARFERLCRRYGVQDYHLHLRYRPAMVLRFVLRSLAFALFVFPFAVWGLVNSAVPYILTRALSKRLARGRDQYDTAGMLFGPILFGGFWSLQTLAVWNAWGIRLAIPYAISLPFTAAVALLVARERKRIIENVRVFVLFLREGEVRAYLRAKRHEIEHELAAMAQLARDHSAEIQPMRELAPSAIMAR